MLQVFSLLVSLFLVSALKAYTHLFQMNLCEPGEVCMYISSGYTEIENFILLEKKVLC